MKLLLALLLTTTAFASSVPTKISCGFNGQYETQKKKLFSKKYKTINTQNINYNVFGNHRRVFDLHQNGETYSYHMSGFGLPIHIKFELVNLGNNAFQFEITSAGRDIGIVGFDVTRTFTPSSKLIAMDDLRIEHIVGSHKRKRTILSVVSISCIQGQKPLR